MQGNLWSIFEYKKITQKPLRNKVSNVFQSERITKTFLQLWDFREPHLENTWNRKNLHKKDRLTRRSPGAQGLLLLLLQGVFRRPQGLSGLSSVSQTVGQTAEQQKPRGTSTWSTRWCGLIYIFRTWILFPCRRSSITSGFCSRTTIQASADQTSVQVPPQMSLNPGSFMKSRWEERWQLSQTFNYTFCRQEPLNQLLGVLFFKQIQWDVKAVKGSQWFDVFSVPAASAASRTDEEEPGGSAQRAGGEETRLWGGESQLGGSAAPGAAEAGGLQVRAALTAHSGSGVWL